MESGEFSEARMDYEVKELHRYRYRPAGDSDSDDDDDDDVVVEE